MNWFLVSLRFLFFMIRVDCVGCKLAIGYFTIILDLRGGLKGVGWLCGCYSLVNGLFWFR